MSDLSPLKAQIKELAIDFGFQQLSVSDTDTSDFFPQFEQWIKDGLNGSMDYLERNQNLRKSPKELHPNTCRILSVRYDYLPPNAKFTAVLKDSEKANISRYALGRDYHKLMRNKLKQLTNAIGELCKQFDLLADRKYESRVFVDSAPVLETSFAEKSGLGWKGKHTLVINENAGSWFFLGEIFINLPLPTDPPVTNQCGSCIACINICPTNAITKPYEVDARRCISYLTIENKGVIPVEYREAIGNRIYGCDDCQLTCPWNRYASLTKENDFSPRHQLDDIELLELFKWTEEEFLSNLQGNPIRRIGYESWVRNIAVGLGNSNFSKETVSVLKSKLNRISSLVDEHIMWATEQLTKPDKNESKQQQELTKVIQTKKQKLIRSINKMLPRDA